jgi:hypothetical protein
MGRSRRYVVATTALLIVVACRDQSSAPTEPQAGGTPSFRSAFSGPQEVLENAIIHRTVEAVAAERAARPARPRKSKELSYHGGVGGIGVETGPKVYLALWGSQWNNNDPSGESSILQGFLGKVGGSSWLNSVTQYCQGVASGTLFCNGSGTAAGNPAGIYSATWADNATAAPSQPTQSQLAAEAVRAAQHFGNTTSASNASVQYVIATATGNNSSGFGVQYCAYHSYTSSTVGDVAYTNLPYMTDAGASCGANFNGLGPTAGITIVEGHELAETITDQFPSGGWLDSGGAENGDKCAWNSATSDQPFGGTSYPVQPLWSNVANSDTGGCVQSYP